MNPFGNRAPLHRGDSARIDLAQSNPGLEAVAMGLLLLLGIALSIAYFGHRAVPNSDFPGFVAVARGLLDGHIPDNMKRLPVLGLMQIALSGLVVNSSCPILTAGLILNCILYTASILVFYRLCRRTGSIAVSFYIALIAALNPLTLSMLINPIVETTLTFFVLITLYCIVIRSRWAYAWAMLASMTRYEAFALIGIALLVDWLGKSTMRHRIRSFGFFCLAITPMMIWLLIARPSTADPNNNYLRLFLNVEHRNGLAFAESLWASAFGSLAQWPQSVRALTSGAVFTEQQATAIQTRDTIFHTGITCAAAILFLVGAAAMLRTKRGPFYAILLFWIVYFSVHTLQGFLVDRYAVPLVWLTIWIAAVGLQTTFAFVGKRIPRFAGTMILIVMAAGALVWTFPQWAALSETINISPPSLSVVYASLAVILCFLMACLWKIRDGALFPALFGGLLVGLIVVSNQFSLAWKLGRGNDDIEFRKLAEWYDGVAKPGEKLATTFAEIVALFAPHQNNQVVHTGLIPGTNPIEFAQACKKLQVAYLAWDSRIESFSEKDYYYQQWGMKKIQPLVAGSDLGPYKYLHTIQAPDGRFIHLYRLDYGKIP
jgi:hypothetical protein